MSTRRMPLLALLSIFCLTVTFHHPCDGQVRLVGISGQQGAGGDHPDNTLFEINSQNGSIQEIMEVTYIPDSHSIGYNPRDGLVYHTGGSETYRDEPGTAFRDNQYMETINLETGELKAVFNANPPSGDPAMESPTFGLDAPRPPWVEPDYIRPADDTGPAYDVRGENEYPHLRGLAWTEQEGLFYGSDSPGIYKITPEGGSTFLAQPDITEPGDSKGIAFIDETLFVGEKHSGRLWILDRETGESQAQFTLSAPVGGAQPCGDCSDAFGGLLGLAQNPENGAIYGIRNTSDPFQRELVIIDLDAEETYLIGNVGMHIASIAFVGYRTGGDPCDFDLDGDCDIVDLDNLLYDGQADQDLTYDLDGDNDVDLDDRDEFLLAVDSLPGDANFSGKDDAEDLNAVGIGWQQPADSYAGGDFDGSGFVDAVDLNTEGIWWQLSSTDFAAAQAGSAAASAVPEPTSFVLVLAGLMALYAGRRQ